VTGDIAKERLQNELGTSSQQKLAPNQQKQMKDLIGVKETAPTRDNPTGVMITNRQSIQSADDMAYQDGKIGALNATTPVAQVLDTVGNAVGAGNVGTKLQDKAAKELGFNPDDLKRPGGYNPDKK
jgi:hypothetical protein